MKETLNRLIAFFRQQPGKQFKLKEIARQLGIKSAKELDKLSDAVNELLHNGSLVKKGKYYSYRSSLLQGTISINKSGEGFVTVVGYEQDFFISPSRLRTALHGDKVMIVPIAKRRSGKRIEAEVVEVIERKNTRVIGTFEQRPQFALVIPDDVRFRRDIYVAAGATNHAKPGQKVVVRLDSWEDEYQNPEGTIVEVLGFPDEKGVDVLSVVKAHDLHFDFPKRVMEESDRISEMIPPEEIERRMDFREEICFTIDPFDAKDFDDAVSLKLLDDGHYLLGVHIADVSYYVREKTELDREAYKRGTSTYLVDQVIPMLPEKLSNVVCSLRPHVDRLTYSVFMVIDHTGAVVDYDIVETIIHSKRRFTYEEIQSVIDGQTPDALDSAILDQILTMRQLSQLLTKKRLHDGSIDFDTPESKFILDENGKPVQCYRKDRLASHRLVEEFMLLANQTVSRHIGLHTHTSKKNHYPFLYRIHDKPVTEKFENFLRLLKVFGHDSHLPKSRDQIRPKQIQKIIEKVKGTKEDLLIEKVAIRSMAKAEYSPVNIGHFGLAFDYYSHFTSPIRRYPDLIVHRLLKEYDQGMTYKRVDWWREVLPEMAKHCSDREKIAMEAERESIKVKQVEFMMQHIGNVYEGIISGVTGFGIFVEIAEFLIEGLIHIRNLEGDYYIFDDKNYRLTGERKKRSFQLGDEVTVRVANINRDKHEVDFELVDNEL
ncbi:ribonuclease R [bacterium]|nr:ribonuclease R [bacterium]